MFYGSQALELNDCIFVLQLVKTQKKSIFNIFYCWKSAWQH